MIRLSKKLKSSATGAAAVEFAILAPVLILVIVGIAQLGILFLSNAGLRSAVAEGARYATIFPRPTDSQIRQRISDARFGLNPARLSTPTIVYGVADGANYADITVSYSVPLDFIFFNLPPVTLTESRRAFIQPPTP